MSKQMTTVSANRRKVWSRGQTSEGFTGERKEAEKLSASALPAGCGGEKGGRRRKFNGHS